MFKCCCVEQGAATGRVKQSGTVGLSRLSLQCHYRPIIWGRGREQETTGKKKRERERKKENPKKFRGPLVVLVGWPVAFVGWGFFFFFFFPLSVESVDGRWDVWWWLASPSFFSLSTHPLLEPTYLPLLPGPAARRRNITRSYQLHKVILKLLPALWHDA